MRSLIYRILQALVILAVASSFAHAQDFMYFKKKAAAGGASVLKDDNSGVTDNTSRFIGYGTSYGYGFQFTAGSTYTLTSVKVHGLRTGTGGTCTAISMGLYNSNGSSLLATASNTQDGTSWSTSETAYEWTFDGYGLTGSTAYRIKIFVPAICGSVGNYPNGRYNSGGTREIYSWDNTSWGALDYSADIWFQTYGY